MRNRPALGAAALTVAAATVLLAGCSSSGHGAHKTTPASSPVTSPTIAASTSQPATTASTTPSATSASGGPNAIHQKLTHVRISDVTFVGARAWALGSADCLTGAGTCDAVEYSADSGRTWRSAPAPKANIGAPATARPCAGPCVGHIRFATARVGYAYGSSTASSDGSSAFFMTTNAGNTWTRQPGGADALETLDGNVIRVSHATPGCPPGCTYTVQTAAVGSTSWHTVRLPGGPVEGDGVALARTGSHAYLELTQNPAGGAARETSTLWSSADDGARWTRRGEPCPQLSGHEVDSSLLTVAPDSSVELLCTVRGGSGNQFVIASTDGAASFHHGAVSALGSATVTALGAASAKVFLVSSDDTYRSTDGGRHYSRLSANGGSSPGQLAWFGFASATVGHGISTDRRSIWTTADAGRSWHRHRFS